MVHKCLERTHQALLHLAHPLPGHLEAVSQLLERQGVFRRQSLLEHSLFPGREPGRKRVAGILTGKQERTSRQGNRFAFIQLSDSSGAYEVVVFSDLLAATRETLDSGEPLLLTVESRGDGEDLRLMAQKIEPLEAVVAGAGLGLRVFLNEPEPLESLKSLLERETEGRGQIKLVLDLADGQEVELELPGGYRLSPAARQAIKAVPGLVVQDA